MLKKTRWVAAFTLLECLVSLLVLSGAVLVFDGLTRLISQEVHQESKNQQKDWNLFSEQLRLELEGSEFIKVENNRLYVQKGEQRLAFGQHKSDDFRKTNENGRGYQPMLYQVRSSQIHQIDDLVSISLVFENGMERNFVYRVTEKS